jgi:hypothetical protein
VDVGKVVSLIGVNIRSLNREALTDLGADGLREPREINATLLAMGKTILFLEVVADSDEPPVVPAEIVASHATILLGELHEAVEVVVGVATIPAKVRISSEDLLAELFELGAGNRTGHHTGNVLPRIALRTGIATRPTNGLGRGNTCTLRELRDIVEEGIETGSLRGEPRGVATARHRHIGSSHDDRGYGRGGGGTRRRYRRRRNRRRNYRRTRGDRGSRRRQTERNTQRQKRRGTERGRKRRSRGCRGSETKIGGVIRRRGTRRRGEKTILDSAKGMKGTESVGEDIAKIRGSRVASDSGTSSGRNEHWGQGVIYPVGTWWVYGGF